ncbi:cupin domain-containing protein [Bowmanella denitrificans]|uniref:Cupin domain-containing protein n=1 Tax=Bowmanella denitrificans TaxID=366582 RepID=A0ABN0X5E6_9ALTE
MKIIKLKPDGQYAESYPTPAEKQLSGPVTQYIANHYSDPSNQFHIGFWGSDTGSWRVSYSEHEYCQLLQGQVELEDEQGHKTLIQAGEHFVIPAGFSGIWHSLTPCKKVYVIFEPAKAG